MTSFIGRWKKRMKITAMRIPEVLLIEPEVFGNVRGFFFESFNQRIFDDAIGQHVKFVQHNHSRSGKGVLRGLHYQIHQPQGKLVRAVRGCRYSQVVADFRTMGRRGIN